MALFDAFQKIDRLERFRRLTEAFDAAQRRNMNCTANMLIDQLLAMGATLNAEGDWVLLDKPNTRQAKLDDFPSGDWDYEL